MSIRQVKNRRPRRFVEIQTCIQLRRATDPFGPEGDLVLATDLNGRAIRERRLAMIVHVLGRAGGRQTKHFVAQRRPGR